MGRGGAGDNPLGAATQELIFTQEHRHTRFPVHNQIV
jgi:hypothetical protein